MINWVEVAFEIPFEYPRWRPAQKNRLERRVATSLPTKALVRLGRSKPCQMSTLLLDVVHGSSPQRLSERALPTLPPFPMYAAFPRAEYYGGSVPGDAFDTHTAYPSRE